MLPIGLDLGTSFVKAVSDNDLKIKFPSLYAVYYPDEWEKKPNSSKGIVECVGYDALKSTQKDGAVHIRPISLGTPMKEFEPQIEALIKHAISQTRQRHGNDALGKSSDDISLVVGLPYKSTATKPLLEKIIRKMPEIKKSNIVLQAAGTFSAQKQLDTAMVVSIGGGTTEIIIYKDKERIFTDSIPIAFDFVTSSLGELEYLNIQKLNKISPDLKDRSSLLASKLANTVIQIQNKKGVKIPIIFSGGGILFAPLADAIKSNLKKYEIIIPEEAEMQNAIGMYKRARFLARS